MYEDNTLKQEEPLTLPATAKNDYYKDILSAGPGLIAIVEARSFKIAYSNPQFDARFSYLDVKQSQLDLLDVVDEAHHALLMMQLRHVMQSAEARNKYGIYRLKNNAGSFDNFYVYVSPVKTYEQEEGYYMLMLPAFSNWKQPYLSFDSKELFLEQFSNVSFGTYEWDIEKDEVYFSDGLYDIYELDKKERSFKREYVYSFLHPDDVEIVDKTFREAFETGLSNVFEMRIITHNNHEKALSTIRRVIFDEQGKPMKVVGSIRDITEQRSIEQDLDHHVKELRRSNRELEEFAYVASHDLQEPLRKISTFCDRLSEKYSDLLTGDGTMYMQRIMASAENMRVLINNLLEFSRVTRASEPFASVSLDFVLRQVKTELELLIEETGTTIQSDKLPNISGSLTQMKQLFANLINNAIKFRREGVAPVINITSRQLNEKEKRKLGLPAQTAYTEVAIADNGIGFDNDYAERIFQIFQRLHGKSEYPGSGIGLAICKKIVEHHNGLLYAEGKHGEGAKFIIILPDSQ